MTRAMHYVPVGLSGNDQQCHVVNTSLARTLYHTTKILDSSKFKANAGNKLRITQIIKFTINSLPNWGCTNWLRICREKIKVLSAL